LGLKSFQVNYSLNYIFEKLIKNQKDGLVKII